MKKKLLRNIGCLAMISIIGFMSSCKESTITIEQIIDIGGAGRFYAINSTANDTVEAGSGIYVGVSYPTLNAQNGDEIKLNFVPSDKYNSKYTFNVTYILPDSTEVEKKGLDYTHTFTLAGLDSGIHYVSMSAGSTEQVIISNGKVAIKINE